MLLKLCLEFRGWSSRTQLFIRHTQKFSPINKNFEKYGKKIRKPADKLVSLFSPYCLLCMSNNVTSFDDQTLLHVNYEVHINFSTFLCCYWPRNYPKNLRIPFANLFIFFFFCFSFFAKSLCTRSLKLYIESAKDMAKK